MKHEFLPGDHLRIRRRGGYAHHVIIWDAHHVIHYSPVTSKHDASICIERIDAVVRGDPVQVVRYGRCDPAEVVLARAAERYGEQRYNLAFENCEHFARWCKTGQASSDQVRQVAAATGGAWGGVGAAALSLETVALTGIVEGTSGPGIMSALKAAGAAVGGGSGAGVAVFAAAPAAVAAAAVHGGFADDPYAPEDERTARRAARVAGTVGAVGGTVVAAAAVSAAGSGTGAVVITTGLKALGAGRMLAGLAVVFGIPLVTAGLAATVAYHLFRRRAQTA